MQQDMLRMQEEMEKKTYKAAAGGGMVTAEVNGKHELLAITIDPEAVDPDDVVKKIEAVTKEDVERVIRRTFEGQCAAAAVGRNVDKLKLV